MSSRIFKSGATFPALAVYCLAFSVQAFNSDGHTDIVWQNAVSNEIAVWLLESTKFVTSGRITNAVDRGWTIVATADFDRNGHEDLLWRSQEQGHNAIWLMNGTNRIERLPLPMGSTEFQVVGTGDFNADGFADVLWHDREHRRSAVWFMSGTKWTGNVGWISPATGANWEPAATGDFNNDANTDIVWRNTQTGHNAIWFLAGTNRISVSAIQPQPDLGFHIAGTGSFNRLGNTDLIWRHTDGRNRIWLMRGSQFQESIALPTETDQNWRIVGAGGYTNGMQLSVQSSANSDSLNLSWKHGSPRPVNIRRRELGEFQWSLLATNYVPYKFTDSNVQAGQRYEYQIGNEYLLTGLRASPNEYRGKVILVIESSLDNKIGAELTRLSTDLSGDGWNVIRTHVPRHIDQDWPSNTSAIETIRSFIRQVYTRDPAHTKAVILMGHVPIPYSGFQNPDGHGFRALPADGIYGDVDGKFTDTQVNERSRLEGPHFSRHDNLSGDGKYDQNRFPENSNGAVGVELAVGRIDFANLPAFKPASEEVLLRRYLAKNHRWRHKQFLLPERVLAGAFFPDRSSPGTYVNALRIGSRLFGATPGKVVDGDPFEPSTPAVWGVHSGWGLPYGIMGRFGRYHESGDLTQLTTEPRFSFATVFGSYCVDWDYTNSLMRSFLATPSYGLAATWFNPLPINTVPLSFEQLGMGETVGSGFLRSVNASVYQSNENAFVALLGDPTLRIQTVAPPNDLRASSQNATTLEWQPSTDPGTTYFVYRSTNRFDGPWSKVTHVPIRETRFTDDAPPSGTKLYQVRAVNLATTGSGSFTNLSQGIFVRVE
ncbi:MAG: FG-GAP-like repeat-containing protein [Verrucomicrobia bacterium]|nr:FG-GAP-like repeat-containing protein [Verrucomicrobiota bacterium]